MRGKFLRDTFIKEEEMEGRRSERSSFLEEIMQSAAAPFHILTYLGC